jgi:hypothetical protein
VQGGGCILREVSREQHSPPLSVGERAAVCAGAQDELLGGHSGHCAAMTTTFRSADDDDDDRHAPSRQLRRIQPNKYTPNICSTRHSHDILTLHTPHCTTLHYTALYYTTLHYTALHYTLYYMTRHCTVDAQPNKYTPNICSLTTL